MRFRLLAWLAFVVIVSLGILAGCSRDRGRNPDGSLMPNERYSTVVIDGCEYIEVDIGLLESRVYSLTHKGNCKNCRKTLPEAKPVQASGML